MTDPSEAEPDGPEGERQHLNQLIDRLRLFAAQAGELAAGRATAELLTGGEAQVLANDLIQAANWLDSLVVRLEDEATNGS
jgi:hypothetical protein